MADIKKPAFNLNMHTFRLLDSEPFFAALSRRIDKRATKSIPTAGVMVNERTGHYEMLYNPDFMNSLIEDCGNTKENADNPYRWVRGVLMHEFYHLIYGHVTTRLPEGGMTKLWNIAADLAINTHIADELPPVALVPGRGEFKDMQPGLTAEAYYNLLKEKAEAEGSEGEGEGSAGQQGSPGEGEGEGEGSGGSGEPSMDDHSGWGKGDSTINDIAQERLKKMTKEAAEEANNRGWGSVSGDAKERILDSLKTVVDWKKVLRSFVKASQKAARRSTIKRINKRFPYIHAGKRSDRTARVAISIDQSGSVGNEMLAAFFSELDQLAKYAEFVVVPFDTLVDESLVFTWKKGEKKNWERVLCGGTDFTPPTKYVNDNKFDGHIILTDMCAAKPIPSKCKRMWMTNSYGATQPCFKTNEKVLEIIS
jgi:predicted metal-dependent peptidase